MKLGCIADDFTGATDLGGLLTRAGARVDLYLGVPEAGQTSNADFVIIALKCRSAPVEDAVAETQAAGQWLMEQGAEQLYWKYCSTFDSTPQGNIGPVAEGLLALTGQSQAVYCPAFPENGRSVFKGYLFVGDRLLSESPMKDHPLNPMTDANLVRVLAPQVQGSVGLWQRSQIIEGTALPKDRHVIADAVEFADLEHIIRQCWGRVLLTGGSALAMPIPKLLQAQGELQADDVTAPADLAKDAVILVGSCSAQTRIQLAAYPSDRPVVQLDPLAIHRDGIEPLWRQIEPLAKQGVLVYASDDPANVAAVQSELGREQAGQLVEDSLGTLAQRFFGLGIRRFVIAGGETSGAVVKALEIEQLQVGREINPGVPWCFARKNNESVALALKSGNFGSDDFFVEALNALHG